MIAIGLKQQRLLGKTLKQKQDPGSLQQTFIVRLQSTGLGGGRRGVGSGPALSQRQLYMDCFNMLGFVLGQRCAQGAVEAQRYRTQFDLETGEEGTVRGSTGEC